MTVVTGLTKERMLAIEAACIVSGAVPLNNLILTRHDGTTVDAGNVRGPQGPQGPQGPGISIVTSTTRPSTPTVGSFIFETNTEKLLRWNGTAWIPPKNYAVGIVGYSVLNADTGDIGTVQTDVGLMCVVVPPIQRRVELTLSMQFSVSTNGAGCIVNIKDNGAVIYATTIYQPAYGGSVWTPITLQRLVTPDANEHDYTVSIAATAGTTKLRGSSQPSYLMAKDIGGMGTYSY